jgi:tetratricopeptide (TPR) repeat protein
MLMINTARSLVSIGLADVSARISRAKGDKASEIAHLRRAVEMQDALGYMEPPEWHYTIRTSLGGALLRDGKAAEAEIAFRKDLELNPRNGRSLFGLLKALEAQSKEVSIEWVKKEFAEAWRYSGMELTVESL